MQSSYGLTDCMEWLMEKNYFNKKSRSIFLSTEVLENKIYCNELNFRKKNEY